MGGPFVHRIDPIIGDIAGVYLWWYGLSYTLGFLGIHLWFRRMRHRLGLTVKDVYDASLFISVSVLLGGRFVEVIFYEREFYGSHPLYIPAYWLGGMSTHGLLLGAAVGTLLFSWSRPKSFLAIADDLVIPGAWVMGVGRIGNFIDGQIVGALTNVSWAVQFPDVEGFRHPVVLYDGAKNLLLIPLLLLIRRSNPARGVVFAHFLLWYALLRIPVDYFREYRVDLFSIGTGQVINAAMALTGLGLLLVFHLRGRVSSTGSYRPFELSAPHGPSIWVRRILFVVVLLFCLTLPSDWTQDVPERYGGRHPGLEHSAIYPRIE